MHVGCLHACVRAFVTCMSPCIQSEHHPEEFGVMQDIILDAMAGAAAHKKASLDDGERAREYCIQDSQPRRTI